MTRSYYILVCSPFRMTIRLYADLPARDHLIFLPCTKCGKLFCSNISAANLFALNSTPFAWSEKCRVCNAVVYGRTSDSACKHCDSKLDCIFSGCGVAVIVHTPGGIP